MQKEALALVGGLREVPLGCLVAVPQVGDDRGGLRQVERDGGGLSRDKHEQDDAGRASRSKGLHLHLPF